MRGDFSNILLSYLKKFRELHIEKRRFACIVMVLALMVAGSVVWRLKYTGIAMTNETFCGMEEHVHTDECYERELVCGMEEDEGHEHTDECYEEVEILICDIEEGVPHEHTEECTELVLICEEEECEGHEHSDECYDEEGELICEEEECEGHEHGDECYEVIYVCGFEEGEEHEHTDECYETQRVLICGEEERAGHVHQDECYRETLICELEEHVHTIECLSDEAADVEDKSDWIATLPDLTGIERCDVVAIAESQLGYTESDSNFELDDDEVVRGYTRYGAWYGNKYGKWDAMFVSFCLYYAEVLESVFPQAAGAYAWKAELVSLGLYEDAEDYVPLAGDVVFFDSDGDGRADRTGVVADVDCEGETLYIVEGDVETDDGDVVCENEYSLYDNCIMGYGVLPFDEYVEEETEEGTESEEPETQEVTDNEVAVEVIEEDAEEETEVETEASLTAALRAARVYNLTYEGADYVVTVAYGEDAGIPEGAELSVSEYDQESETYLARYAEAAEYYGWEEEIEELPRLFNIELISNGEVIEPGAQVTVTIAYLDCEETDTEDYAVAHFLEDEIETIEASASYEDGVQTIAFDMESFSDVMLLAAGPGGNPGGGGGGSGGGSTDPGGSGGGSSGTTGEEDPESFNENAVIYWDTFTENGGTYTGNNDDTTIVSVYVGEDESGLQEIEHEDSTQDGGWSTNTTTVGDCFPNAYASSSESSMTDGIIVITPATGYYVTRVVIACAGTSRDPYTCSTWDAGNAFDQTFTIGENGVMTIDISSLNFSHNNNNDPYYFILIQVTQIPSPLYVQYEYGDIVTYIGTGDASAFETADGWTSETAGNEYGSMSSNATDVDDGVGVKTEYTQYKYAWADSSTEVADWKHYANTITDDAKEQAAAAGYYFTGWYAEYYTQIESVTPSSDGYENWVYEFDDNNIYNTETYGEGDSVELTTHVKLTAQWEPVEMTVTKTVEGLVSPFLTSHSYTLLIERSTDGGATWTEFETVTLSVTGNGSASTTISPVGTGLYRITETGGNDNLTSGNTTMYVSVNEDGQISVTTDDISSNGANLNLSLGVTNSYAEQPPTALTVVKNIDGNFSSNALAAIAAENDTFEFTISGSDGSTRVVSVTIDSSGSGSVYIEGELDFGVEYTITETSYPTSLLNGAYTYVSTTQDVASVTFTLDDATATVTFTNTYERDIELLKVSSANSATVLDGAVFILYKVENGDTYYYTAAGDWSTDSAEAAEFTTGTDGKAIIENLPDGEYSLIEVTAPDGYNPIAGNIEFTLSGGTITLTETAGGAASVDGMTITIKNTPGAIMPSTGGSGGHLYLILGALLVLAAISIMFKKKRGEGEMKC